MEADEGYFDQIIPLAAECSAGSVHGRASGARHPCHAWLGECSRELVPNKLGNDFSISNNIIFINSSMLAYLEISKPAHTQTLNLVSTYGSITQHPCIASHVICYGLHLTVVEVDIMYEMRFFAGSETLFPRMPTFKHVYSFKVVAACLGFAFSFETLCPIDKEMCLQDWGA